MIAKSLIELPGAQSRVASVLKSKKMRSALASQAAKKMLAPKRELAFSADVIANHLEGAHSPEEDAAFFDSRRISEAIVLVAGRPVLFVKEGVIEAAEVPEVEATIAPHRKALVRPVNAVGRIELIDHDTYDWCGTGWRIDDDLIVTNRHVASLFAQKQGTVFKFRANSRGKSVRARIDFREEHRGLESEEFGLAEVLWIAEDNPGAPDMAVLRIHQDPGLPAPLQLFANVAEPGQKIGVVGYPAQDSRNDPGVMSDIFRDIYDVKRFAPGEVVTPGDQGWYLTHDASTLGGNSGSAVFDLETQRVVGLHFGGSFRKTNYAVTAQVIKSVLTQKAWVPVSQPTRAPASGGSEWRDKARTVAALKNRKGYDAQFLGRAVAPPRPLASVPVLKTGFKGELLPYLHFSVLMHGTRRLPILTAENLDGAKKRVLKRKDAWGYDPRIPKTAQLGHLEFYGPQPFDKGHMVRRNNQGWGDTLAEAQQAEEDTFVYTNAAPQMPALNQQTWASLEEYVLENTITEGFRVCVFTGPVFRDTDPEFSGVQVPIEFWKTVVALRADQKGLMSASYLLSQDSLMPTETFQFGAFKTYQVPLKRVEQLASIKFSKTVRDGDVFKPEESREMLATGRYLELARLEDMVLQ